MNHEIPQKWLLEQEEVALKTLIECCAINSWTENLNGIAEMRKKCIEIFSSLGAVVEEDLLLTFTMRPEAERQVLLGGHLDTVHRPEGPFQKVRREAYRLIGPGVADMKGGLVVLLYALLAFERSAHSKNLGWKVCINSDEEIGSPKSRPFWIQQASHFDFALLFEPSFPDGAFVSSRAGSLNIECIVEGVSAHAGRDFHLGKSASRAIVEWIAEAALYADAKDELSFNIGSIQSGYAANIVPDRASCKLNVRSYSENDLLMLKKEWEALAGRHALKRDVKIYLNTLSYTPPKEENHTTLSLLNALSSVCNTLDVPFEKRPSRGVCDGNALSKAGLPTLDSMGVIGAKMHTEEEYMEISSLIHRALITSTLLEQHAMGAFPELMRQK